MGEVYEAQDQELQGTVALKTIRHDRLDRSSDFLDRFRREASLARRVTHTNVCRIFDVGHDGDRIFFTMELLAGETLADRLRRLGRIPPEQALPLVRQIAAGLDALHHEGIVHRDFKTGNVLLVESPSGERAVITDFGLAHPQGETQTMAGPGMAHLQGTPDYMSPEQLMGKTITPATDIYALGLVLYEVVAGRKAYPGGRAIENTVQRLAQAPAAPSRHARDIPRAWDKVILRCLERDSALRPATAGEVAAALAGETRTPMRLPWRWWTLAAAAIVLSAAAYLTPWSRIARKTSVAAGAHSTYLKGQDALDHYYRPHAVDDAIRLFQATIARDQTFALAYAGLARADFLQYWQNRDASYIEPSRTNAEKALSLDSSLASVHVTLGRLYTETGKNDLAAQELDKALQLDHRSAEAYYALATLYDKQGRSADVEPNYQKAMALAPDDWRFPDNLADYYMRHGNLEKALELSKQAVGLTPDNPRALNNLGRIYHRLDRLDEARAAFEKSGQIEPTFIHYNNLAVVLDESGKPQEAAAAYRKALEIRSTNYTVWGNLGFTLAKIPGREAESQEAFQKAIALGEELRKSQSKDPELLSILGRYYAVIGDAGKSIPLLRQATALAPETPQVLLRAADSYEYLHRRGDALAWLAQALAHGLLPSAIEREYSLADLRKDPQYLKLVAPYDKKPPNGR